MQADCMLASMQDIEACQRLQLDGNPLLLCEHWQVECEDKEQQSPECEGASQAKCASLFHPNLNWLLLQLDKMTTVPR